MKTSSLSSLTMSVLVTLALLLLGPGLAKADETMRFPSFQEGIAGVIVKNWKIDRVLFEKKSDDPFTVATMVCPGDHGKICVYEVELDGQGKRHVTKLTDYVNGARLVLIYLEPTIISYADPDAP